MSKQSKGFSKKAVFLALSAFGLFSSVQSKPRTLQWTDNGCHQFSSTGACIQCSDRYYFNSNGVCTQVSDQCKDWSRANGNCLSCYPGYGSPVNGVCGVTVGGTDDGNGQSGIDPNCQCFNDDKTCNACYAGYNLASGVCTPIVVSTPTDPCDKYQYQDTKGKWFNKWFKNCKQVCVDCIDGYYLDVNSKCQPLPTNCLDADVNGKCTECEDGYELTNGVCDVIVSEPVDPCAEYGYVDKWGTWFSKQFFGCKKVCKKCNAGYYLDKWYQCDPLPTNCDAADVSGKCTDCSDGFELQTDGTCDPVVSLPTDPCTEYGYWTSGKWSKIWTKGCTPLCQSCVSGYYLDKHHECQILPAGCSAASTSGACTACDTGYTLENGVCNEPTVGDPIYDPNCASTNANGACTSCYAHSVLINGFCQPVNDQCKTWDLKTALCTSCFGGYTLKSGACVL